MEHYQYEPLPAPSSIRLLKFDPDNKDELLPCQFIIAESANPPPFTALSYVWGDPSNRIPIAINGKIIHVTQSLHGALQYFRKKPALLWADALCINQQDIPEKSHQVNMMAKIYRNAANVTVWLGPDEYDDAEDMYEDMRAFVDFSNTVVRLGGEFGHFDEETGDMHWKLETGQNIVSALPGAIVDPDEEEKARLERFLRLPYFSRTWVLQEIGLASEAVVLWGELSIRWNIVGLFAMFLNRYCRALLIQLGLSSEVERLYHVYTGFSPFLPRSTFLHLISNARRFNATDPRDKVFALLSHPSAHTISATQICLNWDTYTPALLIACHLAWDIHDRHLIATLAQEREESYMPPKELPDPLIQADYGKSTDEVYFELAMDHITRTKTIEILAAVQHDPENPDNLFTPSWVPRWDHYIDTPVLGFYTSKDFASGNKDAILSPAPPGSKSLTVRGTLLTRITEHTELLNSSSFDLFLPSFTTNPDSPEVQELWNKNPIAKTWLLNLEHIDRDSYPVLPKVVLETSEGLLPMYDSKDRNIYDAYIQTWVGGKNMGAIDGFDLNADAAAYWERLFWGSAGSTGTQLSRLTLSTQEFTAQEPDRKRAWQRYRDSAAFVCNKRRFFFTKKGFFGIGPGAMKPGDFVAVLLGADVPFVIREVLDEDEENEEERMIQNQPIPMDRKFRLIGECYVQGIMQGQATRGLEFNRDITFI